MKFAKLSTTEMATFLAGCGVVSTGGRKTYIVRNQLEPEFERIIAWNIAADHIDKVGGTRARYLVQGHDDGSDLVSGGFDKQWSAAGVMGLEWDKKARQYYPNYSGYEQNCRVVVVGLEADRDLVRRVESLLQLGFNCRVALLLGDERSRFYKKLSSIVQATAFMNSQATASCLTEHGLVH